MFRTFQQSCAVNACVQAAIALGACVVSAAELPEPWPAKVRELPDEVPELPGEPEPPPSPDPVERNQG